MKRIPCRECVCLFVLFASTCLPQAGLRAQVLEEARVTVPPLIKFAGELKAATGSPRTGVLGVTFAIYAEQEAGSPLWLETQNVTLDDQGRYSALLGLTREEGLPLELFASGDPRWLGIQVQGEEEQSRILLVSVPYALKAADADRLGGRPASDFLVAASPSSENTLAAAAPPGGGGGGGGSLKGSGTTNFITRWTASDTLGDSIIFQTPDNKIGIGTTTPAEQLHVAGDLMADNLFVENVNSTGIVSAASLVAGMATFTGPLSADSANIATELVALNLTGTTGSFSGGSDLRTLVAVQDNPGPTTILQPPFPPLDQSLDAATAAIRGWARNTTTLVQGVQGVSNSNIGGAGVAGYAVSRTGVGIGVLGISDSNDVGFGVFGDPWTPTGFGVGVIGRSRSPNGIGGMFASLGGGLLLLGISGPEGSEVPVFKVDSSGAVFANDYRDFAGNPFTPANATNADLLDNLDSSQFARRDIDSLFAADQTLPNLFVGNVNSTGIVNAASLVAGSGTFSGPLSATSASFTDNLQVFNQPGSFKQLTFRAANTSKSFSLYFDEDNGVVQTDPGSAAPLIFRTDGIDRIAISPTGEVGIGTVTPGSKLHVSDDRTADGTAALEASATGPTGFTFGIRGISESPTGTGVEGKGDGERGVGVHGSSAGQSGTAISGWTAGVYSTTAGFTNVGGGKIISGGDGEREVFSVAGDGTVTATAFIGDGSGLFNINAATAANAANADTLDNLDSSQFARLDLPNLFAADQTIPNLFVGNVNSTGIVSASSLVASTASLTGVLNTAGLSSTDNLQVFNQPGAFKQLTFRAANSPKSFSLYFDEDNGVVQTDPGSAAPLIFRTDGADRVYITPQGDVGIGTIFPGSKLEVEGEIRARDKIQIFSDTGFRIENEPGSGQVLLAIHPHGKALAFSASPQNDIQITASGNVGVGTTSPTERLDVGGNVKAAGFVGDGSALTGISAASLGFDPATQAELDAEGAARVQGDAGTLTSANQYTDNSVAAEMTARIATDAALQTAIDGKVSKAGDTMTGDLTLPNLFASGGSFNANIATPVVEVTQAGAGNALKANFSNVGGSAVHVVATGTSGHTAGIFVQTQTVNGNPRGVQVEVNSSGSPHSVVAVEGSAGGPGTLFTLAGVQGSVAPGSSAVVRAGVRGNASALGDTAGLFHNAANGPILLGWGASDQEKFRVEGDGDVISRTGDFIALAAGRGIILKSPDGNACRRLSIDNFGALVTTAVICP